MNKESTLKSIKHSLKRIEPIYKLYASAKEKSAHNKLVHSLHRDGYTVLDDIVKKLSETEIDFFLAYGTSLGFVRDGGFIKCDHDMDIGVLENLNFNWETLENSLTSIGMNLKHKFSTDGKTTEVTYEKNGVLVDFFLFMPVGDKLRSNVYYFDDDFDGDNKKWKVEYLLFPKIDKIDMRNIHGVDVPLPRNIEEFLEVPYGKGWTVYDPNYVTPMIKDEGKFAEATFY